MSSKLKQVIAEMLEEKLTENKATSLHAELKKLGDTHYQAGGSSSETKTSFRGGKNDHFDTIHKMIVADGYKKVYSDRDTTEYQKQVAGGKSTATVVINHNGKNVYSVGTITRMERY